MRLRLLLFFLFAPLHIIAQVVENQFYVKINQSPAKLQIQSSIADAALEPAFPSIKRMPKLKQMTAFSELQSIYLLNMPSDKPLSINDLYTLLSDFEIEYIEEVPQDNLFSIPNDGDYQALQRSYMQAINAESAWNIGQGSRNIVIAIIDTGTEITHEDLQANLFINENESLNGNDDDGNGYIDDLNGWDFFDNDNDPTPGGSNSHGTHVAGIAAAVTNNTLGITSLSYNVRFLPLKVTADDGGSIKNGYDAMLYAMEMGAQIINCSWGSTQYSRTRELVTNAVYEAGVLLIAAGGNDGTSRIYYPAGYPHVLGVGAYDHTTANKAGYSNYGVAIDVLAPGGNSTGNGIHSTLLNNSYGGSFGTSMAAPMVSALAGLVLSNFDYDVDQLRSQIQATALALSLTNESYKELLGNGLIQADKAMGQDAWLIDVTDYYFNSPEFSKDVVFSRGEIISLYINGINRGKTVDNATLAVTSNSQYLLINSYPSDIQPISHRGNFSISEPIKLTVREDTPVNTVAYAILTWTYSDGTTSQDVIPFRLVPSALTHTNNSIELTVSGNGRIGYTDYPSNKEGSGFIIRNDAVGDENSFYNVPLLREGGLFFGNEENRLSSSIRGTGSSVDDDFFLIDYFSSGFSPSANLQYGNARFTDLNAGIEGVRYDITTVIETFAFGKAPDDKYIVIRYGLTNKSSSNLSGIRAGIFLDFDLTFSEKDNDVVNFYEDDDIIIQRSGGADNQIYVGATLSEGIFSPWLIDNYSRDSFYFGVTSSSHASDNGFTNEEKWLALEGRNAAILPDRIEIGPSNVSWVLSPDAFNLAVDDTIFFHLVLGYAESEEELRTILARGKERSADIEVSNDINQASFIPDRFKILSVYPNPFNPVTNAQVSIRHSGFYTIELYNVLGEKVLSRKEWLSQGIQTVSIDASRLGSGTYILIINQDGQSLYRKITLIK